MAPTTTNPMDETIPGHIDIETLIPNLMIIIFGLVGLTGNGIVFWLLGFRMHRNAFLVYILNLALADFLFLLCHIINSSMLLLKVPPLNSIFFHCFDTIRMVLYITGLSMLSAISTERCLSVLCPIWYRCRRREYTSAVMCAVIWVLPLLICILNGYFCRFFGPKYVIDSVCLATNFFIRTYPMFLFIVLCLSTLTLLARLLCGALLSWTSSRHLVLAATRIPGCNFQNGQTGIGIDLQKHLSPPKDIPSLLFLELGHAMLSLYISMHSLPKAFWRTDKNLNVA